MSNKKLLESAEASKKAAEMFMESINSSIETTNKALDMVQEKGKDVSKLRADINELLMRIKSGVINEKDIQRLTNAIRNYK